jgi:Uncharacterized conserved protein (DUF2285)/Family of unknown function (DUF6499)
MASGGAMTNAQIPKFGTAWAKSLEDYAYTCDLDKAGWAWEFLRRNERFAEDFRFHNEDRNIKLFKYGSIDYIEMAQRNLVAEKWHLLTFANLDMPACKPHLFWDAASLPKLLHFKSKCATKIGQGNFDLNSIEGQKSILCLEGVEYVVIQRPQNSVRLAGTGCTLTSGSCDIKFEFTGLLAIAPQLMALKMLARFAQENSKICFQKRQSNPLLLSYLIALDGYLEGKTYRQIAQVIYGKDRVSEVWTSETRFMKDKIRRAVDRGISYMEGEYLALLH